MVGTHGIRKFEFCELREQACIAPQWEMTCVVSLIGVSLGSKWNMLLNEELICRSHCGGVLRIDYFRLPSIEAIISSIDWFIAVLVVVAELKSNS